jgi:hypothetical protein
MPRVQREIRRDPDSGRLGCLGPFGTDAAIPSHLDAASTGNTCDRIPSSTSAPGEMPASMMV